MKRRALRITAWITLLLVAIAAVWIWHDPYNLIRAEFARQRIATGLSKGSAVVADHRWSYAYSDDAPADAPLLVMVHGYAGFKENWYPLAKRLRGQYRMLMMDLPGWGESQRRAGLDYGFVAQSERVAQFIEQVARKHGDGEVVLLGHSMGGGIVALVAERHPQAVDRLALIDAAGARSKENDFIRAVFAGKNPFFVDTPEQLRQFTDMVMLAPEGRAQVRFPGPIARIYLAKRKADRGFEIAVMNRMIQPDALFLAGDQADRINQPTLLLWCKQDAIVDPSGLDSYGAKIPQAQKVLLDGCGHVPILEDTDAVADAVIALIETGKPR